MKKVFYLFACLLAVVLAACGAGPGGLAVENTWARPGEAGGTSAIYFSLNNPTDQEDVLLRAESEAAEHVELHRSMESAEGTMSMHPQHEVPVPPRTRVEFEPGGLHVMLINLQEDLDPEDELSLTLVFEEAGEVTLSVPVREP